MSNCTRTHTHDCEEEEEKEGKRRERANLIHVMLGEGGESEASVDDDVAALGRHLAGDELEEGGLTLTVGAHQGDSRLHVEIEREILEDVPLLGEAAPVRIGKGDVRELHQRWRQLLGIGERERA
jgi:hypothetical protein